MTALKSIYNKIIGDMNKAYNEKDYDDFLDIYTELCAEVSFLYKCGKISYIEKRFLKHKLWGYRNSYKEIIDFKYYRSRHHRVI